MVKGKDITIKNATPETVVKLHEEEIIDFKQAKESLNQFTKADLIQNMLLDEDLEEQEDEVEVVTAEKVEPEEETAEEEDEAEEDDEEDSEDDFADLDD